MTDHINNEQRAAYMPILADMEEESQCFNAKQMTEDNRSLSGLKLVKVDAPDAHVKA